MPYKLQHITGIISEETEHLTYMKAISAAVKIQTEHTYALSLYLRIVEIETGHVIYIVCYDQKDCLISLKDKFL